MRRSLTSWTSVIALVVVLVAGCSSEPEPREPDPSASADPDVTTTPPPLPDLATEESAEGASTFVDYYLDVLNYAAHTGDTTPLEKISDAECAGCSDYIEHYQTREAAGGWLRGGEITATAIQVAPYGDDISLTTELELAAGTVRDSSSAEPEEFAATLESVTFIARFSGGSWVMTQFVPGDQL